MQSNGLVQVGSKTRENNTESQRGRNFTIPQPIAEEEQQQPPSETVADISDDQESTAAAFIDSVKKFFAPCFGAVDAASLYIGECRPSKYDGYNPNQQDNVAEDVIMRLRERNGGFTQVKRRSETLEIPTNGVLFDDDDVSAISSHTLEEMERLRLRMAQSSGLSNFQISPGKNHNNLKSGASNIMRPRPTYKVPRQHEAADRAAVSNMRTWNIQKAPVITKTAESINEGNLAQCGSASDSSSSEGVEQRKKEVPQIHKSRPAWSNRARKDRGFKTHPVG